MARRSWLDAVAGERMKLDGEFADRVRDSPFTSQQWNLVMTAVTLRIEDPEDPDAARLVADTSDLDHVADEIAAIGGGGRPGGGSDGGVVDRVTDALGIGSSGLSGDDRDAAERLADEYAAALQERLEEQGKWVQTCATAAEERDAST